MALHFLGSPAFLVCPAQGPTGEWKGRGEKQTHAGGMVPACLAQGGSEGREGTWMALSHWL